MNLPSIIKINVLDVSWLQERIANIPGMTINAVTAAHIDSLIHEAEISDHDVGLRTMLRMYRLQCCGKGLHGYGPWQEGGFVTEPIPGWQTTGRLRTCVACGNVDKEFLPVTRREEPDCWKCREALVSNGILPAPRMILCPECGNKRCPKASNHDLACTGSNDPGQPGSVY